MRSVVTVGIFLSLVFSGCIQDDYYRGSSSSYGNKRSARASGYSETAPGFELPKSNPLVFVGTPQNPTVFQQKLAHALTNVVKRQGGVITTDPRSADLFLIATEETTQTVEVRDLAQPDDKGKRIGRAFALALGDMGANLSGGTNWARRDIERAQLREDIERQNPKQEVVKTVFCYATIEMFAPEGGRLSEDASNLRHVWHAEMQVPSDEFKGNIGYWLNMIFERFGSPDGKF